MHSIIITRETNEILFNYRKLRLIKFKKEGNESINPILIGGGGRGGRIMAVDDFLGLIVHTTCDEMT